MRCAFGYLAAPARWLALPVAVGILSSALGGCAAGLWGLNKDSPESVKEAAVAKRAADRWQALIRRDFAAAYAYYSPASRNVIPEVDFAKMMSNIPYRSIRVDRVECQAEVCTVNLTLTYDPPGIRMTNVPTPLQESWIIERGDAWLVYRA